MRKTDICIIGAGPAGAICAGILNLAGFEVIIIEKDSFPRFTIGESFLPQNNEFFDKAGLNQSIFKNQFQHKDGAEFLISGKFSEIKFSQKSSTGDSSTFQVERDRFDKLLTDNLTSRGANILFNHEVKEINLTHSKSKATLKIRDMNEKKISTIEARFIVDASGLARVLPKLLNIKINYSNTNMTSYFGHIKTAGPAKFNHGHILITVDDTDPSSWYWLIPLSKNKYSLGHVTPSTPQKFFTDDPLVESLENTPKLKDTIGEFHNLFNTKQISNYGASISKSFGEKFVIIGNSSGFIDPIFSSGITIAGKSACLASQQIINHLNGIEANWAEDYTVKLEEGIEVFRHFIDSWYKNELTQVIANSNFDDKIKSNIISILAGHAWDKNNYFFSRTKERLHSVYRVCKGISQSKNHL